MDRDGENTGSPTPELLLDQAYERLKFDIITLRLEPGSKVSETKLSDHYGFGKASVRSALRRLAHEGFVVSAPRRIHRVSPVTLEEAHQIFQLRKLLEPVAARMATGKANLAQLRELDRKCRVAYERGNVEQEFAFLMANRDFHAAILRASGNPRLEKWGGQLLDASTRYLYFSINRHDLSQTWQHGHREILEAMKTGDGQQAEAEALQNLVRSEREVLDAMSGA